MVSLSEAQTNFLKKARVARLATFGDKGIHLVPICYAYNENYIYIGTGAKSVKVKNLERNSEITFLVDEYSEDWNRLKGLMIKGKAEIVKGGKNFEDGKVILYKKYSQYEKEAPIKEGQNVIIKVKPRDIVSWGL